MLQCTLHLLLQHLLQRSQAAEHGIGVLAQDGDALVGDADGMAVKLLAHHDLSLGKTQFAKGPCLHLFTASHGTQAHGDGTFLATAEHSLHAMCLKQGCQTVACNLVDGAFT